MKPSTHRYVLPPVLLGIHAVLLLPLILSPTRLRPPHFPDFGEHPRPTYDSGSKYWDYRSRLAGLYLQYSIPLGIIGIVGVYVSKQLAGSVPLPKDERRKRLAQVIEWAVLFGMGVIEEVWRWGLVRLLISFEGGHGGFRGGEPYEDSLDKKFWAGSAAAIAGVSLEAPSLWEGLYLMGWMWSVVECLVCNFFFFFFFFTFGRGFGFLVSRFPDGNTYDGCRGWVIRIICYHHWFPPFSFSPWFLLTWLLSWFAVLAAF